jgi:hypothetical protein
MGSNGRLGALPRKRFQSILPGDASGGIEYCHAPKAVLRSSHDSTMFRRPIAPAAIRSRAFWYTWDVTYWLPTWKIRPVRFCASITRLPSSIRCTMGFSQYTSLPASIAAIEMGACQ